MFELSYLNHIGGLEKEHDPDKVGYSTLGVIIQITKNSTMFVPWHRVLQIVAGNESIEALMEHPAFAP